MLKNNNAISGNEDNFNITLNINVDMANNNSDEDLANNIFIIPFRTDSIADISVTL